jgi:hypothetical protein
MLPDAYQLDLPLEPDTDPRTEKPRAGFETVEQCQAEDESRALGLRAMARWVVAIRPSSVDSHSRTTCLCFVENLRGGEDG